jgi:hypothetical protein
LKRTLVLLILTSVLGSAAVYGQTDQHSSGLTVYPSFHLKFEQGGRSYLLASTIIVNISSRTVRNLTLKQVYPDGLSPEAASKGIHDYFPRPEGFEESIDGQTYTMRTPLLRRQELTSALVVLRFDGRPSKAEIPPAVLDYVAAGESFSESGPSRTIDLKKYSKYSGSLADFIKRYAGIMLTFPENEGPDWGFSGFASRVRSKTPLGMVEVEGDVSEGRFSLIRGEPGDSRVVLVSWKPKSKARQADTEAQVLDVVKRQIMASSDFSMVLEGASVEKEKLGRYETWAVTSRWKDRVKDRLGEGPVKWYVYNDRTRSKQYVMMIAAQGRGAGPEQSRTPNPEKEEVLMKEMEEIIRTFRPI